MPWKETDSVKERVKFVLEWEKRWNEGEGRLNFAALCREFGISRQVGYVWLARYRGADQRPAKRCRSAHDDPHTSPTQGFRRDGGLPGGRPQAAPDLGAQEASRLAEPTIDLTSSCPHRAPSARSSGAEDIILQHRAASARNEGLDAAIRRCDRPQRDLVCRFQGELPYSATEPSATR